MNFILDPSLVLYMPLYELDGASFVSKDTYGHLCTVTGALWRPEGRSFDGSDDDIDCGSNIALATRSFTLEAWTKRGAAGGYHFIISQGVNVNYQLIYFRYNSDDTFFWTFKGDSHKTSNSYLDLNTWVHWVGTYDVETNALVLYRNGNIVMIATATQDYSGSSNFYVGESAITGQNFNGLIGEIRVYTRPLTTQEIRHNYLATKWRYR